MAVAATVKLAQASLSRLGDGSRGSPRPSRANGRLGDSLNFEQASVSPRRGESRLSENVRRPLFQFRNSRLGGENSPKRETLAWARLLSLGDRLSENAFSLGFFLSFGGWTVFYCTIIWWHGGGMSMHVGKRLYVGELWAWHDFYINCIWEVGYICMCVWSQTWHEQQWILVVGKPLVWLVWGETLYSWLGITSW